MKSHGSTFRGRPDDVCLGLLLVFLLPLSALQAAVDMFVDIEGVSGESTDAQHQDWIEILSYSHGVSQPAGGISSSGGARSAGRVDHEDFSFTKYIDKASPKLALYCCNGTHIPKVKIELWEPKPGGGGARRFFKYELTDVIVTSVRPAGTAGDGEARPVETVTLNYGRIQWVYTEYDGAGTKQGDIETQWDTVTNTGG